MLAIVYYLQASGMEA